MEDEAIHNYSVLVLHFFFKSHEDSRKARGDAYRWIFHQQGVYHRLSKNLLDLACESEADSRRLI